MSGGRGRDEGADLAKGPVVRSGDGSPWQSVGAGRGTRMQVLLGPDDGVPNFYMRRFRMDAGGGMPLHTNAVEHEQYVLRGKARLRIGGRTYEVSAGDVLYIPAGVPHDYEVQEGPFEFLCLVPARQDEVRLVEEHPEP